MRSNLDMLVGFGIPVDEARDINCVLDSYGLLIEVAAGRKQATGIDKTIKREFDSYASSESIEKFFEGLKTSQTILVEDSEHLATVSHTGELIYDELDRQEAMWGPENDRADATHGELMSAALAQLQATHDRDVVGCIQNFDKVPMCYPETWSGFRDYGSTIANLVVTIAYLTNEVRRLVRNGESDWRKPRDYATQPYTTDKPKVELP